MSNEEITQLELRLTKAMGEMEVQLTNALHQVRTDLSGEVSDLRTDVSRLQGGRKSTFELVKEQADCGGMKPRT